MTFSTGNVVTAADYNTLVTNLNAVLSTGSGDSGYGQTALPTVGVAGNIGPAEWNNIYGSSGKLFIVKNHQNTTLAGTYGNKSVGNTISANASLASDIALVTTNRLNAVAVGGDTTSTTAGSGNFSGYTRHVITATFASYDSARYFFNAGGSIRLSFALGVQNSSDYYRWGNMAGLAAALGIIEYKANSLARIGGANTGAYPFTGNSYIADGVNHSGITTPTKGFHQTTSGGFGMVKLYQAASYNFSLDNLYVFVQTTTSNVLKFTVSYNLDSPSYGYIDSPVTTTHTLRAPSTTYLTNSWGAPSMPTGTNSQA